MPPQPLAAQVLSQLIILQITVTDKPSPPALSDSQYGSDASPSLPPDLAIQPEQTAG